MMPSTFPTFLAFLTQALCFPTPASNPWQGLDIPPCVRRERLGPRAVGPEGDNLSRRSESASAASSLRRPSTRNSDRSASASLARAEPFLAEGT
jgi:hypothetical protein